MVRKKLLKCLFVWMCIITIVMPFTTEVLAAALTKDSTTAIIESVPFRKGGPESSGMTDPAYDTKSYGYEISGVNVLKAVQKGDATFADALYCINAKLSLSITKYYEYTKTANDFTKFDDPAVQKWAGEMGMTKENFDALVWLLKNLYLAKQQPELKDAFIEKAFAKMIEEDKNSIPPTTVELIKKTLTDDDIDVIQQWAIWNFTNGTNLENKFYDPVYNSMGNIKVKYDVIDELLQGHTEEESLPHNRQLFAKELYNYLVTEAVANANKPEAEKTKVKYPSIDKTKIVESSVDGEFYKVGPFKVNSGNAPKENYKLELKAEGADLSKVDYKVFVDGEETTQKFDEIFDKEYFIYVPIKDNKITNITLSLVYTNEGKVETSLWEGKDPDIGIPTQPLVLLLYVPGDKVEDSITGLIVEKYYDLALRKFIVSVNGNSINGRTPNPNVDDLVNGGHVGKYAHSKNPILVEKGSKIVYEFRVYNEGEIDSQVKEIVDYLPEGISLVDKSKSTINSKYNWQESGKTSNGMQIIKNNYLADKDVLPAFDKESKKLSYEVVQMECEITGDFEGGTVLTNVAQITIDNELDRDSKANSIKPEDIDKNTYSGNKSNKSDLTDEKYFYAGLEDDDDFEKVVIEGKVFDLALQKFITKVNDQDFKSSREPKVDTKPLVNGENDAKYTVAKTPVKVSTGDIVTFTIRVYNEGDVSGYAEEITDYIPEGLGLLINHKTNYENEWLISPNSKSVKLADIPNGDQNLSINDFEDVKDLSEVDVVLGKTKVRTSALASSETNQNNMINKFNKDNGNISYKDVEITCIVTTQEEKTLKNIAAITEESDENRKPIDKDRDSKPLDDINPDDYTTGNEDDDDYDVINPSPKFYDFALQKFITGVNNTKIEDRVPIVTKSDDGKLSYIHPDKPVTVANGDLVTYTIRVYNEGNVDGYVSEISDDIPNGLKFLPDNETNKEYKWEMFDKHGKETKDINQASQIRTRFLSKENAEDNLIDAFDKDGKVSAHNPDFKDVKVVFEIDEEVIDKTVDTEKRIIKNTAEITEITDTNGKEVDDVDSTPDNQKPGEDDIDYEKVYVKYFDLALEKDLKKIIIKVEGEETKVIDVTNPDTLMKVEIDRKKLNKTSVQFVYDITIRNEGEIEGAATEITDYIPKGLKFDQKVNPDWFQKGENIIATNALAKKILAPGEKASVSVTLDWIRSADNMGKFVNLAEISDDYNPHDSHDIDSTPDNLIKDEDDIDDAPVYISIGTGLAGEPYIVLTTTVLLILATGIILIKKYVVD